VFVASTRETVAAVGVVGVEVTFQSGKDTPWVVLLHTPFTPAFVLAIKTVAAVIVVIASLVPFSLTA